MVIKILLYILWFLICVFGAVFRHDVPDELHYTFGFCLGALAVGIISLANSL